MNVPYTYLIKCVPTGQFYYGVRWAKDCHPGDLWKTYFTSSVYVRALIKKHGANAFEYEVRRVFTTESDAQKWEYRVLQKMRAKNRDDFINQHDGRGHDGRKRCWVTKNGRSTMIDVKYIKEFMNDGWVKGRLFTAEHRAANSAGLKKWFMENGNPRTGIPLTAEHRAKLSDSRKGAIAVLPKSEETRKRISDSCTGITKNNKPFRYDGAEYPSLSAAKTATGLSRWLIFRRGGQFI